MLRRREQIILLLASRYDGLYLPNGSLVTPAGFVPNRQEPCSDCGGLLIHDDFGRELRRRKGTGLIRDRYGRTQPCTSCGGSTNPDGNPVAGAGFTARDPMDSRNARVGSQATTATARPVRTVVCDGCGGDGATRGERCVHCDGNGRRALHAFNLHLEREDDADANPLDDAIDRRNNAGSYSELDRALAGVRVHINKAARYTWLTDNATAALRLLDELYLPPATRTEQQLTHTERALVDLALDYIDSRMPEPIRVPASVRHNQLELSARRTRAKGRSSDPNALARRDQEIRQHNRAGRPVQWIAAEYGLSVSTVYELLNGFRASS